MSKILSISQISPLVTNYKKNKKKVVMCHGAFDVIHYGHIAHFEEAKKFGDILIVSVTSDKYINKGPNRPFFNEEIRLKTLSSLEVVDYVVISNSDVAITNILKIKPNIYCKGPDYKNNKEDVTGNIKREIQAIKKVKGSIEYTKAITYSSSKLINIFSDNYNDSQKKFLNLIKSKHSIFFIIKAINSLSNLKVLTIGETIIDEYVFCEAIGKSGKEPVLVLKEKKSEKYLGGICSVANHISELVGNVKILSLIGDHLPEINFIKTKLNKKIKFDFIKKNNSPTILKKRFVDEVDSKKLLGVYKLNDDNIDQETKNTLTKKLFNEIKKTDISLVVDYGHGFISSDLAKSISKKSSFLTVNTQINSFNVGTQRVNKYPNPDCLIINETELRHELRDSVSNLDSLAKKIYNTVKYKKLVITCGSLGVMMFGKGGKNKVHCPAFAGKVVDKIGSGDAMLSMISICLKSGFSDELTLFLGSIAAAKSVETIGNSYHLKKVDLLKTATYMLK